MAKSARSSRTKTNRTALRNNLHGPAETARAERLNAKLMALVSQPTASQMEAEALRREAGGGDVDVDAMETDQVEKRVADDDVGDDMQIDTDSTGLINPRTTKKKTQKTPSRVQKKRRGKPQSQIVFPSGPSRKGQRKVSMPGKKNSRKS